MTVIASNLSNGCEPQQPREHAEQQPGQHRVGQQNRAKRKHRGRLEALGPQQCVGEVEQQAERDEAGERVIEDHRSLPLQPFAGVGVADAGREEADRERRHEDVHHRMLLLRRIIHG